MLNSREKSFLLLSVLTSLLLHCAYFLSNQNFSRPAPTPLPIFSVELLSEDNLSELNKTKQIVSPSDSQSATEPEETNFLSERDSQTKDPQIKRGDDPAASPAKPAEERAATKMIAGSESKPPANITTEKKALEQQQQATIAQKNKAQVGTQPKKAEKKSEVLDLSTNYDLLAKITEPNKLEEATSDQTTIETETEAETLKPTGNAPFSRAPGSSAAFMGRSGVPDFIPNIRDGDITLLNAKADKFAVFVRRVAIQVFNYIKQMEWQNLSRNQIAAINTPVMMIATLNKAGDLESIKITRASGSTSFDAIIEKSINSGAHDPNPPAAALTSDGKYRFIFIAKSWSRTYPASRNRPVGEQRWLMLQTGLE